jgi:hypothetical protein
MRTNDPAPNATNLQNDLPAHHANRPSNDRRPTILTPGPQARGIFNGWGPRLGM